MSIGSSFRAAAERDAVEVIEREIPAATRAQWSAALSQIINGNRLTLLEYLQEPPGKFSPSTIERQFDKVVRLRNLGVSRHLVPAFTPAQLQAYAQGMRRRRPSRSAQLHKPRRTIELMSFLQHALFEHTDLLIRLIDRRVSQLWRRASEEARRRRGDSTAAEAFVTEVRHVLAGIDTPATERLSAVEFTARGAGSCGRMTWLPTPLWSSRSNALVFAVTLWRNAALKRGLLTSNVR
jgi:hypothetical protein